jgi:mRNA interferase MazF
VKRGTIVLTPFPFTDLTGAKVRPAVVVSPADLPGDDVILAFISSLVSRIPQPTNLPLSPSHADFAATGLKVPSVVKCDKLATVHRHILLGELGILSASLTERLDACLRCALDL